ncbi:MAG TPA: hypothetical protein VG033_08460 [Candidatus Acidoferrales bacterium]|nr:hypothetical protein [Candidatus Acidoferrales bacterium]
MLAPKAGDFACGTFVIVLGLGLNFYSASELLATFLLVSAGFCLLSLLLLTLLGAFYAGKRVAGWAHISSPGVTLPPACLAAPSKSGATEF